MKQINVSTPGKIHLMGEHSAVYGKPAILAAIDKRCSVTLVSLESNDIIITAKNLHKTVKISLTTVLAMTDKAQKQWEEYRAKNDLSILKAITEDDMTYLIIAIGETLKHFKAHPKKGFHITIDSEIPIGSGNGSSAAVGVSIVGGVTNFLNEATNKTVISTIALRAEQKKHGNPSAGDVAAVVHGGLIWFRKETPDILIVQPLAFSLPKQFSKNLMVIQSGIPKESTGEMVHTVALLKKQQSKVFDTILDDQEKLTRDLLGAIKHADEKAVMTIFREGEKNLETIGVVSPSARTIIREIEKTDGAAKICGAGGKSKGSGIILAYHKEMNKLKEIAKSTHLSYDTVTLGVTGVTIERI